MNANRSLRFYVFFALALLTMSFVPNLASAQAYRGKFTLPFSARWGGLLLPAGDYSFKVDSLSGLGLVSVLHDGKILGSVMIGSVSYFAPPDKSNLVAIPTGDAYRVTALHVQDECVIEFQIPKNERQMITREPELSRLVTIPVGKA